MRVTSALVLLALFGCPASAPRAQVRPEPLGCRSEVIELDEGMQVIKYLGTAPDGGSCVPGPPLSGGQGIAPRG